MASSRKRKKASRVPRELQTNNAYQSESVQLATIPEPPESSAAARAKRESQRLERLAQKYEAVRLNRRQPAQSTQISQATMSPQPPTSHSTPSPSPLGTMSLSNDPASTPARLRLDETVSPATGDADSESTESVAYARLGTLGQRYARFCQTCPVCQSDNVHATTKNARYLTSLDEWRLFVQPMLCDECCSMFMRPGKLLGAPKPRFRIRKS